MKVTTVIGCEVHVQLTTHSKAFCRCENRFGGVANSRVCPVCMGLPGTLPVVNRAMIEEAIVAGLALNCTVADYTKFDRKNYIYPDLPKGYQISQYDMPICTEGFLDIEADDGSVRRVAIRRLHMEEDAGKNIHAEDGRNLSFVDFNRCGTPLLEIVSEPDLRSPDEAVRYVQSIREIMRYLDVSDCNMEEASLRCDANVNLWIETDSGSVATPIAEIKNMNSFRSIRTALAYEVKRQLAEWNDSGLTIEDSGKSTRGFDESRGVTVLQRLKEDEADYRYFPEPDLGPIRVDPATVERLRTKIGSLPAERRRRLIDEVGLSEQDAVALTESKSFDDYFDSVLAHYDQPKRVANWMLSEVKKYINERSLSTDELPVSATHLGRLLALVDDGTISGRIAKQVFVEMAERGEDADTSIQRLGVSQITDESELLSVIESVITDNPASVDDFRAGKTKALSFLMGQVMKATRGQANPQRAQELLRRTLDQ